MRITNWDTRGIKVHINDWETYEVTEDNGVDVFLTWYQIKRIAKKQAGAPMTSSSEQPQPKEHIIIPKELLEDIKTYLKLGCDGTLPNESELLKAIGEYSRPHPAPPQGMTTDELWDYSNDLAEVAARKAREDVLKLLEEWDYINNRNFGKPHPVFADMIRLVREKPDEVRKHLESLRSTTPQSEQEQPR